MEEPLVFDATPLIYLARVDRLEAVLTLADSCLVPEPVHEEAVTAGLEAGYPDARHIEAAIDAGDLAVKDPPRTDLAERLGDNDGLSDADVSVLALAARADGTAVMDERRGRRVAQVEGITVHGTIFLVLALLREGVFDREETVDTVDAMIDAGWRCSTDFYARIRQRIEELPDG